MDNILVSGGRLIGIAGIVLCAVVAIWRLLGNFYLGGFVLGTLFQAGTTAVVIGCFLLLLSKLDRR